MNHSEELKELLAVGCVIRLVEDDIYSALPNAQHKHQTGEFVRPRSGVELNQLLDDSLGEEVSYRMQGNMALATVAGISEHKTHNSSFGPIHGCI